VSVPAPAKTDPGRVLLFRGTTQVGDITVGSMPDMVSFTPDGKLLAVANEGAPNSYGLADSVDPEGSISVIATDPFRTPVPSQRQGNAQPVATIDFAAFNVGGARHGELPTDVRVFGPGASVAQDLEPEYITIADDSRTAWVSLQENNALAQVDLRDKTVTRMIALGYADHGRPGHGIDASDRDEAINIANWPVKGMYLPDGIANYTVGGARFVLTANEGEARDWPGISSNGEEARRARSVADLTTFPDAADDTKLGRLNVTPFAPATSDSGKLTTLYAFGSRSFSIRAADGTLAWDSGDDFECITALVHTANFNASNSNNTFDNRSDDKGPEPETVVVGSVEGRQLAFVALERIGGVMVYDVSDPGAPVFQQYLTTRVFDGTTIGPDSGPEGMVFIPASVSPTGRPVLAVGNEVSGTVNLWGLAPRTDQLEKRRSRRRGHRWARRHDGEAGVHWPASTARRSWPGVRSAAVRTSPAPKAPVSRNRPPVPPAVPRRGGALELVARSIEAGHGCEDQRRVHRVLRGCRPAGSGRQVALSMPSSSASCRSRSNTLSWPFDTRRVLVSGHRAAQPALLRRRGRGASLRARRGAAVRGPAGLESRDRPVRARAGGPPLRPHHAAGGPDTGRRAASAAGPASAGPRR
jgi:Choice-of-anchor I domain